MSCENENTAAAFYANQQYLTKYVYLTNNSEVRVPKSVFIFKHNCVQNYVSVSTFFFKKMQKVFKEGFRLFLVFGCFGIWSGALSANNDIVSFLPGLPHQPSFRQYSGYLNAQGTKKLHYW